MTKNATSRSILWTAIAIFFSMLGGVTAHADEKDDRIAKLNERVESLEKIVVKDPFRPDNTIVARLEAVEDKAKGLAKADAVDGKADDKTMNELQRSVKDTQKNMEDFERRMKAIEQEKRGGDADEVKELRRDMKSLQGVVEALKDRVSKLEAKR